MKERIKSIRIHIADLEDLLLTSTGPMRRRYAEEIINAQFELSELLTRYPEAVIPVINIVLLSLKLFTKPVFTFAP